MTILDLPWYATAFIAINVAVTVLTRLDMYYYSEVYVKSYALIPSMLRPGALFTSAFLHDGWVHLSMNMILLYVFPGMGLWLPSVLYSR